MDVERILSTLGVTLAAYSGDALTVTSPIDGRVLADLAVDSQEIIDQKIGDATHAFDIWRHVPAPKRGELVRLFGEVLRENKELLGELVTWECGKVLEEGKGEVQEMIDICDFAVGLSRQLYGLTIASERDQHVMQEKWYPLGVVGVISAFNFPVAVWAWNTALALVCGNAVVWKPSEKTPLTALACQALFEQACQRYVDVVPDHLCQVVMSDVIGGKQLVQDKRIALVSATGCCAMGKNVAVDVMQRFGKVLLELGGNNAAIVAPSADLDVAIPSILFGAIGTAGQRCTTTRRLFVHKDVADEVISRLAAGYRSVIEGKKIGNPLGGGVIVGPLIDRQAGEMMMAALVQARNQGGNVIAGGELLSLEGLGDGVYVSPALVGMSEQMPIVMEENFAPILYVMTYRSLEAVMTLHNAVEQGLSSSLFTTDMREAEYFRHESDCGIANVNLGTSGAEIGGAFGGEKATGGGRESGSDSWKSYMRRQTSTSYYGYEAPELAQGVVFNVD